ncbi:MAG: hypothetical protein JWO67_3395 [Streptosporangiaceae bacterium]|jgi:hypothetical protein|nr:hypothetical protein [Streptosporangiaceae bacterium]
MGKHGNQDGNKDDKLTKQQSDGSSGPKHGSGKQE